MSRWLFRRHHPKLTPLALLLVKFATIVAFAAVNVAVFLYVPFYTSYRSITQYKHELATIPDTLRKWPIRATR
jgi:hypothetical protein